MIALLLPPLASRFRFGDLLTRGVSLNAVQFDLEVSHGFSNALCKA